ncbi:MAG: galactose-1-phosphate uridylyltransferase [Candidatus Riflebacteria bacterium]|nr:galactose-1-phosphate uridylyltransferase [Candidatus Riflebacteria bacterium]
MPELRLNLATREWIVYATERARRPEDFRPDERRHRSRALHSLTCPFCPGNEDLTERSMLLLPGDDGWAVRVVPNKFPALADHETSRRWSTGAFRKQAGFGYHEVVVEHRRHDLSLALMSEHEVDDVLLAYRIRASKLQADPRVGYVVIFKNHGPAAGCSQEHPHSQIVATPVVPEQIRNRVATAVAFYDDNGECVYCHLLREELEAGERIVLENEAFVAYVPFAAYSPFHIWICPKRHTASFSELTDGELPLLARTLRTILFKIHGGLNDPDYNLAIRSVPESARGCQYYHWYLSVVPRVTSIAGFELGSGMYINTALPEESARFLREQAGPTEP